MDWASQLAGRNIYSYGLDVTVYQLDPLQDPRWDQLSLRHPRASVFHTSAWLSTLQRAYGYEPVALTTSPPGSDLENGLVFCRIRSWLTGNRVVSLPFSDHCEPLVENPHDLACLLSRLENDYPADKWKYIEIRPIQTEGELPGFVESKDCWLHNLDLRPPAAIVFRSLHANIRRNIQRGERHGLRYDTGVSEALLLDFYGLLILTRRRHHLPPQPLSWFRTLLSQMSGKANISVAYKGQIPIAAVLILRHKDTAMYKYGAFDYQYRQFGGMSSLLWRAIQTAQQDGILQFDLGRSDFEDTGLIAFKDRLASVRSSLKYWRCGSSGSHDGKAARITQFGGRILAHMPDRVLTAAGAALYRHAG